LLHNFIDSLIKTKITYHILFWLIYYLSIGLITSSYDDDFLKAFIIDGLQLPLKILLTYFILYYLFPTYFLKKKHKQLVLLFIPTVILAGIIYRLIQGLLVFPCFYPKMAFTPLNFGRFIWALFDIFFPVVIAMSIMLFKSKSESIQREQELQKEKLHAELSFLKAQTNPHFLFNTLNNIYGLALVNSPQVPNSILKLSELFRFILRNGTVSEIKLEDEIKIITDYIELEKLRYGNRLNITFDIETDNPKEMIAPLLLLPFVENSFKHGASESRFNSFINIKLKLVNQHLFFTIANSKELQKESNENGIGIQNVLRQLQLIYGTCHQLTIQNSSTEFLVTLTINLKEYEKNQMHNNRG